MGLFLAATFIIALIALANALAKVKNEMFNRIFDWLLLLSNIPLLLVGIGFIFLPDDAVTSLQAGGLVLENLTAAGLSIIFMALWAMVASLRSIRQFLGRGLPFDPASPVHTLALVLSGYLVGNTLLTLTQGGLEALAESAVSTSIGDVVFQQFLFVMLALFGVGLFIRRHGNKLRDRLAIERPTRDQLWMGLRWTIVLVVIQWLVGAAWTLLDPARSDLLNSITETLVSDFDTVGEWFILALSAGIGEELLFRGALQPVFGLGFTSLLFAIAHVQYGITPVTLIVFVIGLVLGYIRQRSNTTVAILVHFGYNFILGLLALLASYLQQFLS